MPVDTQSDKDDEVKIVLVWNGLLMDLSRHTVYPQMLEGDDNCRPIHLALSPCLEGQAAVDWMRRHSAVPECGRSEPVAWAVVTSDGDPREANSIHWPATCRHTHNGDAKASAQAWADRFGYTIVPLYAPSERNGE